MIARSVGLIALAALISVPLAAQPNSPAQPKAAPKFEVASVKPCDPHTPRTTYGGRTAPGRVDFTCQSLLTYVRHAYVTAPDGREERHGWIVKTEGGPSWVNSDRYEINAKAEDGASSSGLMSMMRSLLEDRFKLKVHRETRQVPVYALTVAKSGLKVAKAKVACFVLGSGPRTWKKDETPPPFCGNGKVTAGGMEIHGSTMEDFCLAVSARLPFALDRRLMDKTGVSGKFDFDLKWSDDDLGPAPANSSADPMVRLMEKDQILLEAALRRLGLQLVPTKGPGEFLVIDHAERPTPN